MLIKVRSELPKWLVDNGYLVGAEVGVYKGEYTEMFCQVGVKMIYAVDPWTEYRIRRDLITQKRQDFLCGHTHRVLDKYPNCKIIRKSSMDAVKDFEDESLDFVYIDGNHNLKEVTEDITEWEKKVRKGGIVSGHDYFLSPYYCDVKAAVDAFVATHKIKTLVSFGSKAEAKRAGDRYKSWLWKKN